METRPKEDGYDFDKDLGIRIDAVSKSFKSRKDAAFAAEVSVDQLLKYINAGSKPSLAAMARMCAVANVSLDWLATGKGPMMLDETGPSDFQQDLFVRCIVAVHHRLGQLTVTLKKSFSIERELEIAGEVYQLIRAGQPHESSASIEAALRQILG